MYQPLACEIKKCCWVSNCLNIENTNYFKMFYSLPTDAILREIWLARVGKPIISSIENIYLCEDHFKPNDLIDYISKGTTLIPYFKMSQVICRLCMSIVPEEHPYHVLSNTIPTDVPPDLKNTSKLAIVIAPEPLQNIVKFCMPDLIIQTEPIPLICQNCFKWIWKLFVFKMTCIEVDKRLRGNLSVEAYGKMVLCRACPQTFGTNFIVLVEQSSLGMFLMDMFSTKYSSKIVPLRLCTNCYEILKELLEFQLNCYAVEEKMKCHMALTQNQEIVRTDISKSKASFSNENLLFEDRSNEHLPKRVEFVKAMIKYGMPLKNKVTRSEKDEIWSNINQELQGKGILCNVLGLKNTWASMIADIQKAIKKNQSLNELQSLIVEYIKMDQQTDPVPSVQLEPLITNNLYDRTTIGITPNLKNNNYSYNFHLGQQTQFTSINQENSCNLYKQQLCRDPNPKIKILDEYASLDKNVSIEVKPNLETSPSFGTVANNESMVNPSVGTVNRSFLSNTHNDIRSENCPVVQAPVKSRKANRLSNILKPDISKRSNIPENVAEISESSTITIFSNKEQLDLLETMRIEYILYQREVGDVYGKLPFKELLARIIEHHKKYQSYSLNILLNCWKAMKKSSLENKSDPLKTVLQEKVLEFLELESQHRQMKVHPKILMKFKRYKKKKHKRSEVLFQDKIDLVEAVKHEYDALKNEEKGSRSIWKRLTDKIHKKGFKNWSHVKIYALWSRMKVSALVHEKNSNDLVDRELWKLLQQYNLDKKTIQNNKCTKEIHEGTITMETNKNMNISLDPEKNKNGTVATQTEHKHQGQDIDDPTSKSTVNIDRRKFNTGRTPNRKLVFPLSLIEKIDFLEKVEQEFNNKPAPWPIILTKLYNTTYKNWDKTKIFAVWNQLKVSSIKNEKNCDMVERKMWNLLQKSVQPQRRRANCKISSTGGCSYMETRKEKNMHPVNKNRDHKKSKVLSEAEKLILFKNIKKEYLTMINIKQEQNISRPWKTIIQRVHENYYKNNFPESKIFAEWTKMRKSATLHENTNGMTEIDWKVVRLMKLAQRMKGCRRNLTKKEISYRTKPIKNIGNDKTDDNLNKTDELEKKGYVDWCYKKKLDLITTVKSYGSEVFRKCHKNKNDEFWLKIKKDFQNRGYKYSEESLKQHWEDLQGSANMAWAEQKIPSELDDIIIKFMKTGIIFKKGNREYNENIVKESPMAEKVKNEHFVDKEQVEDSEEESIMLEEINDKYVSLEDIKNYNPVVPSIEIIELSSDDEAAIDFECEPKGIGKVDMIEKSKETIEKEEIAKLKLLMKNVGVMKDYAQGRNISEILTSTRADNAKMHKLNITEDSSVIVIESDD